MAISPGHPETRGETGATESPPPEGYFARDFYQDAGQAQVYDRARFRSLLGRLRNWFDQRAMRRCLAEVPAGAPVLDIACGTGRMTAVIAESGFAVTGSDISPAMLHVARARLLRLGYRAQFVVADAERLPLRERAYRAATAFRFLGNLPREVRVSALRTAGQSADLVIVDHTVWSPVGAVRRWLLHDRSRPKGYPWAVVRRAELEAELREAGLVVRRRFQRLPILSDCVYLVLERR